MEFLRTPRLVLRGWTDADRAAFAAINADPEVMAHLGPVMSREQSDAFLDDIIGRFDAGAGLWCVEVVGGPACIGFVGLNRPRHDLPFTPCVEVGWRLRRDAWGRGYATEGARAALRYGFGDAGFVDGGLAEIVSFTAARNARSRAVMERLGMARDPREDFEHPALAESDPLRPHVLYRLDRTTWLRRHTG